MSISEFFNRKARAFIAAGALALGLGGGYAGHEAAQKMSGPQASNYTLAQIMADDQQTDANQPERIFFPGQLRPGFTPPAATVQAEADAVAGFTARITDMQQQQAAGGNILFSAVDFVNDLRVSENLSERDYAGIVKDYNTRVGRDVTLYTGNWQSGIGWQQEANLGVHLSQVFGNFFGDDEDLTPQQLSREVGNAMQEGQSMTSLSLAGGAFGGFALGGLLFAPVWLRAGRRHPKVEGTKPSPKAGGPKPL